MTLPQTAVAGTGCPAPDILIAAGEDVLPESLERCVQLHLERCRRCAMLRHELRACPLAEPTLEEIARLRQRIKAGMQPARRRGMRYAAFAASVAIVFLLPLARERKDPVTPLHDRQAITSVPDRNTATIDTCVPGVVKAPLRLPLASAMVMRGPGGAGEQGYLHELGRALAPYRADDFRTASERLERLALSYPRRAEPTFYLGVARLLAGDAQGAAGALESAKRIGSEELDDDIAMYLSAARHAAACNVAQQ